MMNSGKCYDLFRGLINLLFVGLFFIVLILSPWEAYFTWQTVTELALSNHSDVLIENAKILGLYTVAVIISIIAVMFYATAVLAFLKEFARAQKTSCPRKYFAELIRINFLNIWYGNFWGDLKEWFKH